MSIWHTTPTIESVTKRAEGTMAEYLNIQFIKVEDDALSASMPVDHRTQQPLKILNGGASCALAETVGSTAANFCVNQKTHYCVGLSINASHISSARAGNGDVIARATPVHCGRSTHVWEILIKQNNKLICISRLTMAVLARAN